MTAAAILTIIKLISCAVTGGLVFRNLRDTHQSTWIGKIAAIIVFLISIAFIVPDFMGKHIETEKEFWISVEKHPSKEMYRLYLEKYPEGEFKEIATTLLKEISAPMTPPIPVEVKVPLPAPVINPEPTPLPEIELPTDKPSVIPMTPPVELPPNSNNQQSEPETLYVDTQQMILRAGAGKDYSDFGRVYQGDTVMVIESAMSKDGGNWVKVKTGNLEGWLNKKYLRGINTTNTDERICIQQASQDQKKIVETFSGAYDALQAVEKEFPNTYNDIIETVTTDINNDGEKELFYALGHPLSGNCGYDIGVLLNLGEGKWKRILTGDCHSGCWTVLGSSNNGFRDIMQQDMSNGKSNSKCIYNTNKEQYICSNKPTVEPTSLPVTKPSVATPIGVSPLSDIVTKTQAGLVMKTASGTFEIKFYYDPQKDILKFDDRTNNPVVINSNNDISVIEFEDTATSGVFEYSFFEDNGYEMERKQFNPKAGYFTIELPYYSIAKTLKVKKTKEEIYFLSKDISDLMSCNNNKICEVEYKENFSTCIPDCASSNTKFSEKTKQLLMENNWVIRDAKTGDIVLDKRNYRE
jgi:hypothetical protein